jgi:hypothetical protein
MQEHHRLAGVAAHFPVDLVTVADIQQAVIVGFYRGIEPRKEVLEVEVVEVIGNP